MAGTRGTMSDAESDVPSGGVGWALVCAPGLLSEIRATLGRER